MTLSCGSSVENHFYRGCKYITYEMYFFFFFPEEEMCVQGFCCNMQEMQNFSSQTQEDLLIQELDLKEGNFQPAAGVFGKVLPAGT